MWQLCLLEQAGVLSSVESVHHIAYWGFQHVPLAVRHHSIVVKIIVFFTHIHQYNHLLSHERERFWPPIECENGKSVNIHGSKGDKVENVIIWH